MPKASEAAMPGATCEDCSAIKQLRLETQLKFVKAIRTEFSPILAELKAVSEKLAVQTEQLRVGGERFQTIESRQRGFEERLEGVEQWQSGHDGAKREAVAAGRRSGLIWAAVLGGLNLALQLIMWVAQ